MADSVAKAAARARLRLMVAATSRPTLTDDDLDVVLDSARIRDSAGLWPTETGWDESWDLNAAAAEGWRIKAGQVAGDYTFTADDASYSRGDVLASMERMVSMYAAKVVGSTSIKSQVGLHGVLPDYEWTELLP